MRSWLAFGMGKAHTLGTWGWTDAADQILSRERNLYSTPVEIIGPKGKHSVTALSGGGNDRRHMDTCFLLADVLQPRAKTWRRMTTLVALEDHGRSTKAQRRERAGPSDR